jgi:hypothetical protein
MANLYFFHSVAASVISVIAVILRRRGLNNKWTNTYGEFRFMALSVV